jgi:type VI secretion system protein ImpA
MILVDELLQPIAQDNPSGAFLRFDPVYDAIKEARREEENLNQGAWQRELKTADLPQVISLSTTVLTNRSKDLQIAAWLTEASLRQDGFGGLAAGLKLLHGLLENFWDTLYPPIEEEGDLEWRATPLEWVAVTLPSPVRNSPLNRQGHSWYQYSQSRQLGYEDRITEPDQKRRRDRLIAEGRLEPEIFDQSFAETPKAFYVELQEQLDASLTNLAALGVLCDEKFGEDSPWFSKLQTALQEVRRTAHILLTAKREAARQ